ncbi:GDP-mannose transporter 1, partial [Cryomyces minteri]
MSDDKKREDFGIELGDRRGSGFDAPPPPKMPPQSHSTTSSPLLPILAYCGSSILMTVTNKYVLSGMDFNLNFFLLCVQSVVCVMAIQSCKSSGIITYRDFNSDEAKK